MLVRVDRSTIARAAGEIRPLLAELVAPYVGVRLRTLAEVIERLRATRATGIIDDTEIRVRRPRAGSRDRDVFTFGKSRQNAVKSMVVTEAAGRARFVCE